MPDLRRMWVGWDIFLCKQDKRTMKLPKVDNSDKYVGLYVVDFGDQCSVGYTAEEVAALLESEKFADVHVYKIYRAQPDGQMELTGVSKDRFFLESGMFFHCPDCETAESDYDALLDWYDQQEPPCRAKLQLAQGNNKQLLIALIYPAEYEQEIGNWMLDSGFLGHGPVDAGISQVTRYYQAKYKILKRTQMWPQQSLAARGREELLASAGVALQR